MARYSRALVFPSIRTALKTLIEAESFPSFELFAALGDRLEEDHLHDLVEQMDHGLNNRIGQYLYGVLHLTSRPKALYKARPELLEPDLDKARNEEYTWLARHAQWRLVRGELVKFAKQVAAELSKRSPDEALEKMQATERPDGRVSAKTFRLGDYEFNDLTPTETDLLELLWSEGRFPPMTREDIMRGLWPTSAIKRSTAQSHLKNLRKKLAEGSDCLWGISYHRSRKAFQLQPAK
jgi:hypothetical protein